MIQTEQMTIGTKQFVRTYSDSGYYIHGGSPEGDYAEAIDPADAVRTYTETDIPVEGDETEAEELIQMLEEAL